MMYNQVQKIADAYPYSSQSPACLCSIVAYIIGKTKFLSAIKFSFPVLDLKDVL